MTGKKPSSPTELKVADALAERSAWDEGSEVSESDLWVFVQPRLPRGDAGRAYADSYAKKAAGLTEAERIAAGQRMFFDKALKAMEKNGQLARNESGMRLGPEPLWRRVGVGEPLEIYTPGWHGLKDAEARKRASDRKLLNAILKRKAFEVRPDSENYQAIRESFNRYGVRPEHPIVIDDSTDPPFVLDGRTRLAVAQELGLEGEVLKHAHRVRADSSFALNELILGNLHRRQLTSKEIRDVRGMLEESEGSLEAAELERIEAAVRENEDRLQRRTGEKDERIRAALTEDASRSNRLIAELIGASDPTVGKVRDELMLKLSIHRYEFPKGGNTRIGKHSAACWCGEGEAEPKPNRKISDEQIEEIIAEDLSWPEIVSTYGVGQAAAQNAKTRADAIAQERSRASQPHQTDAETVRRTDQDEPAPDESHADPPLPEAPTPSPAPQQVEVDETPPRQAEAVNNSDDALHQMVTLFRAFAHNDQRELVFRLFHEMSDEDQIFVNWAIRRASEYASERWDGSGDFQRRDLIDEFWRTQAVTHDELWRTRSGISMGALVAPCRCRAAHRHH